MINWKTISLKELAGYICEQLKKHHISTVLVGGACVTFYTRNQHASYDLDFVSYENRKDLKSVLELLGFHEHNKYFQRHDCPWLIEFVAPPVAVGDEPITKFQYIKTKYGTIKLLRPIDCIKDRLAGYFYWDDRQSLDQAVAIHKNRKIDLDELAQWAKRERCESKFSDFLSLIQK
ncbi:MAG: hypothetical protein KDK50_04045 [Chlamydiia bacterium]|nr:hypothetical protein [Chlamydiia bacterium]